MRLLLPAGRGLIRRWNEGKGACRPDMEMEVGWSPYIARIESD